VKKLHEVYNPEVDSGENHRVLKSPGIRESQWRHPWYKNTNSFTKRFKL